MHLNAQVTLARLALVALFVATVVAYSREASFPFLVGVMLTATAFLLERDRTGERDDAIRDAMERHPSSQRA